MKGMIMMNYIDLHIHSVYSDGTCTPAELIAIAEEKHLSHIALTDHDTIDGIHEAIQAAAGSSVTLIPGVELSTDYGQIDVHIVGLGIDCDSPVLAAQLEQFRLERIHRNKKMCELLAQKGFSITYENLTAAYPDAVLTRAHFARYLYDKGEVSSMRKVFDKYINSDGPCYVPRKKITPMQAVSFIKKANGTAVLAHPLLYHMEHHELCELITQLKQFGLDAIETFYSCNEEGDESYVRSLANEFGLALSGGSDFHGTNKPDIEMGSGKGNLAISSSLLEGLHLSGRFQADR